MRTKPFQVSAHRAQPPLISASSQSVAPTWSTWDGQQNVIIKVHDDAHASDARASAEDDGAGAVAQHPPLGVPQHGARQHPGLDLLADPGQLLGGLGVVGAGDVLLDDRPLVEICLLYTSPSPRDS